ncbi:hypothetical protein [Streptomyces niveus]|uniref:hypothetical protein n=1 Tax=Streptomyces niveus TaxID=193462 RepID=UPI0034366941
MFEHPELLDEALTLARRELLIISPWIKNAIITMDFLGKLETRLTRGVRVNIAYERLRRERHQNRRRRRTQTHQPRRPLSREVHLHPPEEHPCQGPRLRRRLGHHQLQPALLQGDRDRTYRMEEGSLVRDRHVADAQHDRYLTLIDEQRR